jgi:hypothetical protein
MTNPWVCFDCGARQAERGPCARCNNDDTCDLRDPRTREDLHDIERRLAERRDDKIRFVSVALGLGTVIATWLIPGFWSFRAHTLALPLLIDQWILATAIAILAMTILGRTRKKRFPYLRDDRTVA